MQKVLTLIKSWNHVVALLPKILNGNSKQSGTMQVFSFTVFEAVMYWLIFLFGKSVHHNKENKYNI